MEQGALLNPPTGAPDVLTLHRIFTLWTLKEAYTKCLGLGLGFDFSRIRYEFETGRMFVDAEISRGFDFVMFDLELEIGGKEERYVGVLVRRRGDGEDAESTFARKKIVASGERQEEGWLRIWEGEALVDASDEVE